MFSSAIPKPPRALKGSEILLTPLPDLLIRRNYHTTSDATHKIIFNKELVAWDINILAHKAFQKACKSERDLAAILPESAEVSKSKTVHSEHYLCGDEQSVCGRFAQNALVPVSTVAFANKIHTRFGDFKICQESHNKDPKVPDFVGIQCNASTAEEVEALEDEPRMRIVGEAKTPWVHDLQLFHEEWEKKNESKPLRKALGQIARYMHMYQMKFGFLTTYDYTIFLMQEYFSEKKRETALFVSQPIAATDKYVLDNNGNPTSVTVRQCLFAIACQTNNPGSYTYKENTINLENWVSGTAHRRRDSAEASTPQAGINFLTPMNISKFKSPQHKEVNYDSPLELHSEPGGIRTAYLRFPEDKIFDLEKKNPYVFLNKQKIYVRLVNGDEDDFDHKRSTVSFKDTLSGARPFTSLRSDAPSRDDDAFYDDSPSKAPRSYVTSQPKVPSSYGTSQPEILRSSRQGPTTRSAAASFLGRKPPAHEDPRQRTLSIRPKKQDYEEDYDEEEEDEDSKKKKSSHSKHQDKGGRHR